MGQYILYIIIMFYTPALSDELYKSVIVFISFALSETKVVRFTFIYVPTDNETTSARVYTSQYIGWPEKTIVSRMLTLYFYFMVFESI